MKKSEMLILTVMLAIVMFLTFFNIQRQNTIGTISQAKVVFKLITAIVMTFIVTQIMVGDTLHKKICHQELEDALKKMAEKVTNETEQQRALLQWQKAKKLYMRVSPLLHAKKM
jgi:hypothetical protein